MKKHVETHLGGLTVYTDREDWEKVAEMLVDVAEEMSIPLPRALYYGPTDYTRLLAPGDFSDRHLTRRGVASPLEYWHRDEMVLLFWRLGEKPLGRIKAMLAHELVHHSDNVEGLNITSYALPCIYGCVEDFTPACVTFFKVCLDCFRNASVNSRLPGRYRELCVEDIMEQAREATRNAARTRDDIQRGLARFYTVILTSSLLPFQDVEQEAGQLLKSTLSESSALEGLSLFIRGRVERIHGRKPSIAAEESYIRTLKPLLCSILKQIFHQ